jgi:hypothetical protein
VRPDGAIVGRVAEERGAIGIISFAFLDRQAAVHALAVDGQAPSVTNPDYPISRPLYLLSYDGDQRIEAFLRWTASDEGQRVLMRRFVGTRLVTAGEPEGQGEQRGSLVVYTEVTPVYDGGIYYYPHRPFNLLTRYGETLRRVANHRGDNDETPTRVALAPGIYLIRTEVAGTTRELFVRIDPGETTVVHVGDAR